MSARVGSLRRDPLLRVLWLARPLRARLILAVLAGAAATGCGIALLATSGFLLARASQHPNILAIAIAVVAVRGLSIGRGVFRYAERLASHDAAFRILTLPTSGSGPSSGWSGSPQPGCARCGRVTCWRGWSATWTPPKTCSCGAWYRQQPPFWPGPVR